MGALMGDIVKMPIQTDFQSRNHFYLRIEPSKIGNEKHSREELVAEMSACLLYTHCGDWSRAATW
ncbi:MAG: hypothetical protein IPN76_25200 [Saprospiraceae bacterium]|nr:hypothetical protein [Saprospiraceae bacterium]